MTSIAVFDSGLGGLTVLSRLQRDYPSADFIYLGDSARTPYGTKTAETVTSYTRDCISFLEQFKPDCIVAACNTASALALPALREDCPVPLVGTIVPAAQECLRESDSKRIGVIATPSTVKSGAYTEVLHRLRSDVSVTSVPCPLFVPLVEEGIFSGDIVDLAIDRYLSELRTQGVDTLLLGCTHYPLLKVSLQKYFGDSVSIIECSDGVSRTLKELLPSTQAEKPVSGTRYFVTDALSPFSSIASVFLKTDVEVEVVEL